MKGLFRENAGEAIVGLFVVILAVFFVLFAWNHTGGGQHTDGYKVTALFPNAAGVNVGTDVRVAGLKIGSVAAQKLDPQSFQVAVTLALDPAIKLPADSSASVTSEGLLGSTFVALTPGGSETALKNGDTITDTQGAMDLMALIGQFINKPSAPAGSEQGAASPKP
ncbi:outer membrane lipid asymmetry maintenance protein MlaD [Sphingomonas sp. BIUV-7]|uniref:Outer membrane lipid asymmetry maintenance protein MlaD n=1 Tax=Sphingomonas natans TaxID=3063330 RepID=A0ABT8YDM0_9SPHN|nr:outer membrane lipid asymmetry maintenance protein MlaD [Sphingomonas sp. BIUV-7]MDO6416419.1 outer membrane lipid asymmetry maintenance protein MlaD [Sphingomonas sp. BIUV-7]